MVRVRGLFLFVNKSSHSTQHKAQSTKHREQPQQQRATRLLHMPMPVGWLSCVAFCLFLMLLLVAVAVFFLALALGLGLGLWL
jgi:hypothetical protein